MQVQRIHLAGLLLFAGATQCVLLVVLAESLYQGYDVSHNFLSDLGANCQVTPCFVSYPSSATFNAALILMGALAIAGSVLARAGVHRKGFLVSLGVFGAGTLLAGVFPETSLAIHTVGSFSAFVSAGIAAVLASRFVAAPFNYVSLVLGGLILAWLIPVLFSGPFSQLSGGTLGAGFTERMAVYPIMIWLLAFGTYLMTSSASRIRSEPD